MSEDREDIASIAEAVEIWMTAAASVSDLNEPWEVDSFDIGEVEITTHTGQRFRLTVEEIDPKENV